MNIYRLDALKSDSRYCSITGHISCHTDILAGRPALPRMERNEEDVLEYVLDEDDGGLLVGDYLPNIQSHLPLISTCAEAIVSEFRVGPYELLPARVRNEKGRIHATNIVVLNLLEETDCLDWDKSELSGSQAGPRVKAFGKWGLLAGRLPERDLFRVRGVIGYFFSEPLVQFIDRRGFTSFYFEPTRVE